MNDFLVGLFQIIITILLTICPTFALGFQDSYLLVSLFFVGVLYLVRCVLPAAVFNKAFAGWESMTGDGEARNNIKLNKGGVLVEDGVFGDNIENYYGTQIPLMGPYDGVRPADIKKKLGKQEYQKTAYPYRPETHFSSITPGDSIIAHNLLGVQHKEVGQEFATTYSWHKQDVERWYPNTNRYATNTRDCTNYPAGHPGSCLIAPERIPSIPEALPTLNGYVVDSNLLDEELRVKEEKFSDIASTPKLLKSGEPWPALFKNAPGQVGFDTGENPPPVLGTNGGSGALCRTCKVGGCMKAYCGSRQIEPGTDNIINPVGYMADFLRDVALI